MALKAAGKVDLWTWRSECCHVVRNVILEAEIVNQNVALSSQFAASQRCSEADVTMRFGLENCSGRCCVNLLSARIAIAFQFVCAH